MVFMWVPHVYCSCAVQFISSPKLIPASLCRAARLLRYAYHRLSLPLLFGAIRYSAVAVRSDAVPFRRSPSLVRGAHIRCRAVQGRANPRISIPSRFKAFHRSTIPLPCASAPGRSMPLHNSETQGYSNLCTSIATPCLPLLLSSVANISVLYFAFASP